MAITPSKKDPFLKWQLSDFSADFLHMGNGAGTVLTWFDGNGVLQNNNAGQASLTGPVVLGSLGGAPTVSHGVPVSIYHADFVAQAAAISSQNIYTVPAARAGFFRITWLAKVTQVASSMSVLGGGSAFQVTYADGFDGSVVTTPSTAFSGNSGNALTTQGSGVVMAYAASGSNVNINFGYTSGGTTPMQYILHVRIEDM